jgi:hypothetical protein
MEPLVLAGAELLIVRAIATLVIVKSALDTNSDTINAFPTVYDASNPLVQGAVIHVLLCG